MQIHKIKTKDHISVAFYHWNKGHEKLVVIAPGFYNSKDAFLLKDLAQALSVEYDVMAIDFRGHGNSGGLFHWTSKEYLDLLAVIKHASKQYQDIGVIGFSLGAATTLISATKTSKIKTIVAVSPPAEFEKIEFRLWQLDIDNDIQYSLFGEGRIGKGVRPGPWWFRKTKPIDAVARIKQPILYIHGTDDWIIKHWHSQALYKKTVSLKRIEILEDAPHAEYLMRKHSKQILSYIHQWLEQTL